ncbi:MAG: hypothetical protein U5R31_09385 [Acidimicrobiia bacterium]|nr:hypothetical protein [Acidimicrobiia bacterium]
MSWYVARDDGTPPAGFPGDNDWWHVHEDLCWRDGQVVGDGLTDEECAARGGTNLDMSRYWMAHTWIVPGMQHYPDVFVNHHPCLQPGGIADFTDPCWTAATTPAGEGHDHGHALSSGFEDHSLVAD